MKTIKEPRKNIALLWKCPDPVQKVYRPMYYLLRSKVEDGLLLYNIVTSEMVLLNDKEMQLFNELPAMYTPDMNELIKRHFIVKEDFDESNSVLQLRALLKKIDPPKRVAGFTILPTTECNARCFYCFESNHKRCTMTVEIAGRVVDYIEELSKGEKVEISWFGGEPLVAHKRISQICDGLRQKNIKYRSSIVTNAYLFDEELVQTAKEKWNLTHAQITLDGTEEIYNNVKAFVNPTENPYKRVLKNIDLLLDADIGVNIRLNVTNTNGNDLCDLVDELSKRFGGKKKFSGYSHAVYDGVGFEPLSYDDSDRQCIDQQTLQLDSKLRENGLLRDFSKLPYLRIINCMADNDSCRLIYPDGTVGKCENKSSNDGIGDIYLDITDEAKAKWYKEVAFHSECERCVLYPYCINLNNCPENGRCTETKLYGKINKYTAILGQHYQKVLKAESKHDIEQAVLTECEV